MPKKAPRPSIWLGHVTRRVRDVTKSSQFFQALGLRPVMEGDDMAIFELRGGTHLLLFPDHKQYKDVPNEDFDLMVENIELTRESIGAQGVKVSRLKRDRFHTYFEASDPDGKKWRINSDHTEGRAV